MNIQAWLNIIAIALAALRAVPGISPQLLAFIADGEASLAAAIAAHNAAQTDQSTPLTPLNPIP